MSRRSEAEVAKYLLSSSWEVWEEDTLCGKHNYLLSASSKVATAKNIGD